MATFLGQGRTERALDANRKLDAVCGPPNGDTTNERTTLLHELGNDDSLRVGRALAAEGLALERAGKSVEAERVLSRARHTLERATHAVATADGFADTWPLEVLGDRVYFRATLDSGNQVVVVAELEPSGELLPIAAIEAKSTCILDPFTPKPDPPFAVIDPEHSRFYPSLDAPPIPLGPYATVTFSQSDSTFMSISGTSVDRRSTTDGALLDHFTTEESIGASGYFIADRAFVAADDYDDYDGQASFLYIDLIHKKIVASGVGQATRLSPSRSFLAVETYTRSSNHPELEARVWDTRTPDAPPKRINLGRAPVTPVDVSFDPNEKWLVSTTRQAGGMGQRYAPQVNGVFDLATGRKVTAHVEPFAGREKRWATLAHDYGSLVVPPRVLVPSGFSLYQQDLTFALSRDGKTLALAEAIVTDGKSTDVAVLLIDPSTHALLSRVSLPSSRKPGSVALVFGSDNFLEVDLGQDNSTWFVDRRTGELQQVDPTSFDITLGNAFSRDGTFETKEEMLSCASDRVCGRSKMLR